jgi:hypothetical protein
VIVKISQNILTQTIPTESNSLETSRNGEAAIRVSGVVAERLLFQGSLC